jgi:hypothetical protein
MDTKAPFYFEFVARNLDLIEQELATGVPKHTLINRMALTRIAELLADQTAEYTDTLEQIAQTCREAGFGLLDDALAAVGRTTNAMAVPQADLDQTVCGYARQHLIRLENLIDAKWTHKRICEELRSQGVVVTISGFRDALYKARKGS